MIFRCHTHFLPPLSQYNHCLIIWPLFGIKGLAQGLVVLMTEGQSGDLNLRVEPASLHCPVDT